MEENTVESRLNACVREQTKIALKHSNQSVIYFLIPLIVLNLIGVIQALIPSADGILLEVIRFIGACVMFASFYKYYKATHAFYELELSYAFNFGVRGIQYLLSFQWKAIKAKSEIPLICYSSYFALVCFSSLITEDGSRKKSVSDLTALFFGLLMLAIVTWLFERRHRLLKGKESLSETFYKQVARLRNHE